MIGLAVVLGVAAVVAVAALAAQRHNLRAAVQDLARINRTGTDQRLRLTVPDREMERLFEEINRLVDQKKEQTAAYERREQELRQEIANISHDLRTPLTSIRGYLQLIRRPGCSEKERDDYLNIIEARAQTLQKLIVGFYDLSRLEAGGYTLERCPVRLEQVIYELAAAFYTDFEGQGMEPVVEAEDSLPPVMADPHAVGRVYANLMQNALKHGSGPLRIRLRREGDRVVTSFRNRAPGLLPQDVEHLFDRFYTADKMRTGSHTGLGLAIVRKLCQQMGAETEAELRDGQLTVTVRWPASDVG